MQSSLQSAERAFAARRQRPEDAETWLGELLDEWSVRGSVGRWLAAARPVMETQNELVLFAQYDPVLLLFSVEIWQAGKRVYGIDDWLG